MATKLEENAKLREMIDTLETAKNDLQVGKNNIADVLGSPFTGNDKLDTTRNTLNSIRSTFVSNLNKKGVSTASNTPFKILVENVGKIEQGNTDIPNWYKPKNIIFDGFSSSLQQYPSCIAVENYIYFLCKNTLGLSLLRYDTLTNVNNSLARPSVCDDALMIYHDGYIYRIGGYNDSSAAPSCQRYNIKTNTWSYISNMITPRGGTCGNTYSDEIHVLYGYTDTNYDTVTSAISEYYKISTNTWSTKTNLPASRNRRLFVCSKTDTYTFCITGTTDPSSYWDTCISSYKPAYGTLTRVEGVYLGFATSINNMLYTVYRGDTYFYVGGYNQNGVVFSRKYDKKILHFHMIHYLKLYQ
ncbi:TPA: kelch repeat-containing protein [Clostridioides difficile]|nr:kelch repeat-containing protein [Clostridioides difficile]